MSTDVEMAVQDEGEPQKQVTLPSSPDLITSIALFLSNKVRAHDLRFQTTKNPKTNFTSSFPPQITIDQYLFHLVKNVRT